MNLDSYFTYGLKFFLITVAGTTTVCIIIGQSVTRKIERYNSKHPGREAPTSFVASLVRIGVSLMGMLTVMHQVIPLNPFIEVLFNGSSLIALCATLAAKESFSNYIAGLLLSIHRPFKVGDSVVVKEKNITGIVEEITFRHTALRTESGSLVTIPNSVMNTVAVENLSMTQEHPE